MNQPISRAQFLRGDFSGKRRHIRPPWSKDEREFLGTCTRCDACLTACPENILAQDPKGFPLVNFIKGECTFCGECAKACTSGAMSTDLDIEPWTLTASIGNKCLPYQGVVCGRCAEECEVEAINMKLIAGGMFIPQLNNESCNGCGACYRVCPATAIELYYNGAIT